MRRELWMFSLVELSVTVGTFEVGFCFALWDKYDSLGTGGGRYLLKVMQLADKG